MLHIIPIQSKDEQRRVAETFGESFDERAFAYLAVEEGEDGERKPLGFMQFTLGCASAEVLCLREAAGCDDLEAMIILARAAFSFIHRIGLASVSMKKSAVGDRLADALCLTGSGDVLRLDLMRYFAAPCGERAAQNIVE